MNEAPEIHISGQSSMGEIMQRLPGARRALFARYHLGGCQSCGFANEETLAQLCARAGDLPVDEVVAHLLASHAHDQEMLISPRDLQARLAEGKPTVLVDIRTREEHEAVALTGSEFFTQELQQQLFAGDPETFIVLYDHTQRDALDRVAWFRGHGLKQTYGLAGGIDAWSREVDAKVLRYKLEIE